MCKQEWGRNPYTKKEKCEHLYTLYDANYVENKTKKELETEEHCMNCGKIKTTKWVRK